MKKRQTRKDEAKIRNDKWSSLSLEQQLKELKKRPGSSKKQIEKILNKINKGKVVNVTEMESK